MSFVVKLAEKLNFNFMQINGCRYFGPRKDLQDLHPPEGSEVFVGKLPADYFEDELFFLFSRVGQVYDMRLMVNFSGENRGFGYVRFFSVEDAEKAIATLDGVPIRSNSITRLYVTKSTDHRTLVIIGLPMGTTSLEVETVYNSKMPGEILKVESLESRRPMFLIHFASHRAAAVTKRNHFTESLPAHWGKHVTLMWQPNKEVEERLKAKKERDSLRNLVMLSSSRQNHQVSSSGQIDSSRSLESSMTPAATLDLQEEPSCIPAFGNSYFLPASSNITETSGHENFLNTRQADLMMNLKREHQGVTLPSTAGIGPSLPVSSYLTENSNRRHFLEIQPFNPAMNIGPLTLGENLHPATSSSIPPGFSHVTNSSGSNNMLGACSAPEAVHQPVALTSIPQYGYLTENSSHKDLFGAFSSDKGMNVNQSIRAKENFADISVKSPEASYGSLAHALIQAEAALNENLNAVRPVLGSHNMIKNQKHLRF